MRDRSAPARIGVVLYEYVEPIDVGGTVGVVSMAKRILPNLSSVVIARRAGPVRLAGDLTVEAHHGVADAPDCDVHIVCGGPGWPQASRDGELVAYLKRQAPERLASVCTGALVLASSGALDGRAITTRRNKAGAETDAPIDLLADMAKDSRVVTAAIVEDVVVTGGGVSLAIDATLYLIGKLYGSEARDEVARLVEYDRAYAANRDGLGHMTSFGDGRQPVGAA
ncbi:DJ-1/PfpI family protein [Chelatococcus sambhunathii]|uniref:DJ-1/PfpI family protein n=1 Tax=Chelatococcus sambhunathii TaxID=363953 RepID=A0ABU1DFB9_9HYPH|nr:DJ-1/PfpI family protein [Chelatococcus sambhunathii]MDR4306797.1 DJ-1/PfpI family protein [Chelatococcus sambhunathii]